MEFSHKSVLLNETIDALHIKPDGIYVDGTLGGGGHSYEICKRLSDKGRLIGIDQDAAAIEAASERLGEFKDRVTIIRSNYCEMKSQLNSIGVTSVDGIILDLGVSSYQLDNAERGFSYHNDAPLDMRMSGEGLSAKDVVNGYDYQSLARIIFEYGEEKFSRSIASKIVKYREHKPIETTMELAEIIKSAVPQKARREKNPCKKTFQAIRIEVNKELEHLNIALDKAFDCLNVGGRLCIITFHSLEDRLVKQRFQSFCKGCICPPDFPQCICGRTPRGKLVNRKPIEADEKELAENNRSRSAKLRVIEKIKD